MTNQVRIIPIAVLALLFLLLSSASANGSKSQKQVAQSRNSDPAANHTITYSPGMNPGTTLSGDIFLPILLRPIIPGTFSGKILFNSYNPNTLFAEIFVMNADGSGRMPLLQELIDNYSPSWSPDNTSILFTKYAEFQDSQIYKMAADGSSQIALTNGIPAYNDHPAWSPDGFKIAFISDRPGAEWNIYVMDEDGANQTQLTFFVYHQTLYPTWSPDGSKIAFITDYQDLGKIYTMNANGSNLEPIYELQDYRFSCLDWSPDGSKLAFSRQEVGDPFNPSQIFTISPTGTGLKQITPDGAACPSWSGDGTQIAYNGSAAGGVYSDVYVMNADGSSPLNITNTQVFDYSPAWSN